MIKNNTILRILFIVIISLTFGSRIFASIEKDKKDPLLDRKSLEAQKIDLAPKIDGILDDEIWNMAPVADKFIQYSPYNGKPSKYNTEVRILYDDNAIYIGAMMYDPSPDSIFKELGERDADMMLNADQFSIDISPYNDGINGASFKVSVSNVQSDRPPRSSTRRGGRGGGGGGGFMGGGDSWDAVWESKTSIIENGWIAEIKIPYSALRFPKDDKQVWGVNFWRSVRRDREQSSWNYVDREIGTTFNHLGELSNINNIEPPLRLSLTPYLSGYLEKYSADDKANFSYNGGLDLKYGITEAFTLDATLVPDFGQVRSDDQVLNLSPYEVKYNENRPFFMEGTELFNKGDVFYSRRIGSTPTEYYAAYDDLSLTEEVIENPQEAGLFNATKISGRTKSGLGIGIFNAMTKKMHAIIEDTETGDTREVMTEPFTNYNMVVIDQSLKNNSYISFANTNVWRNAPKDENYYTANVTATDFNLRNKTSQYSVSGQAALSQKYYDSDETALGHAYQLRGGKTGGMLRVQYELQATSDTYDPNDMGYLKRNNDFQNQLSVSYNTYQPFWIILTSRNSITYSYHMLYKPRVFTSSGINLSSFTTFENYMSFNIRGELKPQGTNDYYEPRVDGRFYHRGPEAMIMFWFDTDRSKKISSNIRASYTNIWSDYDQHEYSLSFHPNFKFSDRFSMDYEIEIRAKKNDIGYVDYDDNTEEVFFGIRDNTTIENSIESGYIFNADSYISLRLRHYWSRADYLDDIFVLQNDGNLLPGTNGENHDYNYNAFNIDLVYTWRFAPGSEMSVVWKNSIYASSDQIYYDFGDNWKHMFDADKMNSISLKILYYLDYQYLKKRR